MLLIDIIHLHPQGHLQLFKIMATLKNTIINDTGFLVLPSGTDAQRPGTPTTGMIRVNTNTTPYYLEVYNGTAWVAFLGMK